MMKTKARFATLALATGLLAAPAALFAQGYGYGPQGPPPGPGYSDRFGQDRGGWDAPPDRFTRDLERDAFRQGLEGARHDLDNHRRPNVNNRDEFRNYHGPERRVWRDAFQAGYRTFWDHQGPRRPY